MTVETHTLTSTGAEITYDVRPGDGPVLFLLASPMDAGGFGTLAGHFPDRTVVTYDPRGTGRSRLTAGQATSTPEQHAEDISRVVEAVGGGPVDVFASSGGAINALAAVAAYPSLLRTLVAHEPPLIPMLPDREAASAATRGIAELYQREGIGPAMVRFIMIVGHQGEIPAGWIDQPAPGPADFGLPAEDNGDRTDPLIGQNLISSTHHEPDIAALRSAPTRIVLAVGDESKGELAHRATLGTAAALGLEVVHFPGGHNGFLGGEYGQMGDPDNFAATLRRVLAADN